MTRLDATLRGLAIFALVWQALWLAADGNLRRIALADPAAPAIVILGLSMVAWLAVWPFLFGPLRNVTAMRTAQVLSMTFVVAGGLLLLADRSAVGSDGWFVGASVLNLGAGLAGLYLNRRTGIIAVVVIVVVETLIVFAIYIARDDAWPLQIDLVFPLYALALGLAAVAARHALSTAARGFDLSLSRLARQEQARAETESADTAVTLAETRLHETVLNTLTAIVRGGLPDDAATRQRLRQRAEESAQVLRSIAEGADVDVQCTDDLRIDLAGAIADLENAGIAVHVQGVLDLVGLEHRIDPRSYAAAASAVREALINALRHSGAREVSIAGRVRRAGDRTWWRVVVTDDGCGFEPRDSGYGLDVIVVEGIGEVAGEVAVVSRPGRGTEIRIDLPLTGTPAASGDDGGVPLRAIGIPVLTAFGVFSLYSIGVTWQFVTVPWANAAAAAVFVGVVGGLMFTITHTRYRQLSWWAVVGAVALVPLMTWLEKWAQPTGNPTGDWTSEAAAAVLFVIASTGPVWAAPAALVSWFIAQEARLIELTQPGTIVIVIAALLGWQLRRAAARTANVDREVLSTRQALAASQQRLAYVRGRYRDVDASGLIALLEGIASGGVDPADGQVRALCLREERMIRSVLRLHPERIAIHRDLVALAGAARDRNVDLAITSVEDVDPGLALRTVQDAQALLGCARPGSQARASVTRDERGYVFRLVVQVDVEDQADVPRSAEPLDEGVVSLEERIAVREVADSRPFTRAGAPLSEQGGG